MPVGDERIDLENYTGCCHVLSSIICISLIVVCSGVGKFEGEKENICKISRVLGLDKRSVNGIQRASSQPEPEGVVEVKKTFACRQSIAE